MEGDDGGKDFVLLLLGELPLDDVTGLAGPVQDAQCVVSVHLAILTQVFRMPELQIQMIMKMME